MRVDTGAGINCINSDSTLFPKVQLKPYPHILQNFGNSAADIQLMGEFQTFLEFKGVTYLNTFIVTDANRYINLLSHQTTFRMGVLKDCYSLNMMVEGSNVADYILKDNREWNHLIIPFFQDHHQM